MWARRVGPDACVQALMAVSITKIDCVGLEGWIPSVDVGKPTWAIGGVVRL